MTCGYAGRLLANVTRQGQAGEDSAGTVRRYKVHEGSQASDLRMCRQHWASECRHLTVIRSKGIMGVRAKRRDRAGQVELTAQMEEDETRVDESEAGSAASSEGAMQV